MQTLLQDLRYALRQLRHAPTFTLTALLTLGIGIGATTAIFTLTQAIMLKSLPVADPCPALPHWRHRRVLRRGVGGR